MTAPGLPLGPGSDGDAVRDLHRRLTRIGLGVGDGSVYDDDTVAAVRRFQSDRAIVVDGICGPQTWAALVEADHRLGERMLYLRSPMTRGDDVADLQQRLGSLGFDAGWVDGIFGPDTERALREFQLNVGLTGDGVLGHDTVEALDRLAGRRAGERTVIAVREAERLRSASGHGGIHRIVVGEPGTVPALAGALSRRLRLGGAEVLDLHHPDPSEQARRANEWGGDVYLGLTLTTDDPAIAYFATDGFESAGGRTLAVRCAHVLAPLLDASPPSPGMRLPILRETRMPAVWCRLGPPSNVVPRNATIADALRDVLLEWCRRPIDE